jgi:predicted nucleic acid-binding protein
MREKNGCSFRYWVILAVRNADDVNHPKEKELMKNCLSGQFGQIIVLNFIFDETVTLTLVRTQNKK